jgi:hypothetical protein
MAYIANTTWKWWRQLIAAVEYLVSSGSDAGAAGARTPTIIGKVNATAIVDTTSVNSTPLAATSTPYKTATVTARTVSADADTISTANTTAIYIMTTADDLTTAYGPLMPGQFMSLPDNCDLADFNLGVVTATEGVIISSTV